MDSSEAYNISPGQRSKKKAYIVMVGLTGAGKSSTLNSLFDRNCDDAANFTTSATQSIIEYQIKIAQDDGVELKDLCVVDTPGFADTSGDINCKYQKDSCIMATLEEYLTNHEELKSSYPTAVLLVVNFNDRRIEDEKSHFVQFLKGLEVLLQNGTLIDRNPTSCNLVIVLTHFMSAEPELQMCPEPRIRIIQGLIKSFTTIPSNLPIVIAENKAKIYVNTGQIKQNGDYYELPNGDLYPYNLFKAMVKRTRLEKVDKIGRNALIDAFKDPLKLQKSVQLEISLLPSNHQDSLRYLPVLQEDNVDVNETCMTKKLDEIWSSLPFKIKNPICLVIAKRVFMRENIKCEDDLPKTVAKTLKLLRQIPVDERMQLTLNNLGIHTPSVLDYVKYVGYFYRVEEESPKQVSPFNCGSPHITHTGFSAPSYLRADLVSHAKARTTTTVAVYQTKEAYVTKRFKTLFQNTHPSMEIIGKFDPVVLPGHNIISEGSSPETITGIKEFRKYMISVTENCTLDGRYVHQLNQLPKKNKGKCTEWALHFVTYGVHILQFAFIGGFIKVTATKIKNVNRKTDPEVIVKIINDILANVGKAIICNSFTNISDWKFQLEYYGGDSNLSKPKIDQIFGNNGIQMFQKWINSLKLHPVLLLNEIRLEHVSAFIQKSDQKLAAGTSKAANRMFGWEPFVDLNAPVSRANVKTNCNIS